MNAAEREALVAAVDAASPATLARIEAYAQRNLQHIAGVAAIDPAEVPEEILLMIARIAHAPHPPPSPDEEARWADAAARLDAVVRRQLRRWTPAQWDALRWLRGARGAKPTKALAARIAACEANGRPYLLDPPVAVKPTVHGGVAVGRGLFALVPLLRGQLLMQFTGRVTEGKASAAFLRRGRRADYVIDVRYGGRHYTVDPLDAETSTVVQSTAAFLNEPSAAPFAVGGVARDRVTGRNVRVVRRDQDELFVEFADATGRTVTPAELARRDGSPAPLRANCQWFDFPVPLDDLYALAPHQPRRDVAAFHRTDKMTCVLEFRTLAELRRVCSAYANLEATYNLTANADVRVGDAVVLHDEVFVGLHRAGVVLKAPLPYRVRFVVLPEVAYCLPHRTLAGRVADGHYVPFANVHLCADVAAGEELLCLYGKPIATRGQPCPPLAEADLLPPWHAVVPE